MGHEPVRLTAIMHIDGQRETVAVRSIPSIQGWYATISGMPVSAFDRAMAGPSGKHHEDRMPRLTWPTVTMREEVTAHQRNPHPPPRAASDEFIIDLPNPFQGLRADLAVSGQRVLAGAVSQRRSVRPRKTLPQRQEHEPLQWYSNGFLRPSVNGGRPSSSPPERRSRATPIAG